MSSGYNLRIPDEVYLRVVARLEATTDGCWRWPGATNERGYGRVMWDEVGEKRRGYVHRVVWLYQRGPIPQGLELDHLCRNKRCCNPAHLEPVTHAENVRRAKAYLIGAAMQRAKTHCPHGHEYTPDNTYRIPSGGRGCRACKKNSWRRRQGWKGGLPVGERTHCPHGHEYSAENTYVNPKGSRVCRTCVRSRRHKYRSKEAAHG